jgi:hypothetical protein
MTTTTGYADPLSPAQIATQMALYGRVDNPYGTSPGTQQGQFVVDASGALRPAPISPPPAAEQATAPVGIVGGVSTSSMTPEQVAARRQAMMARRETLPQAHPKLNGGGQLVDAPQQNPVLSGTVGTTSMAAPDGFGGPKPPGIVSGGGIRRFGYK